MVIAAPVAYSLAYYRFPGKSFLEALIYLPMALPPTVIGFYLIIVMGPKGFVGKHLGDAYRRIASFYLSRNNDCVHYLLAFPLPFSR